ncbi:MAG: hypothetical protein WCH42_07480 [Actinomycetes bacterium]
MSTAEVISTVISTLSLLALFLSFLAVARSNRQLAKSMRLSNLQAMVVEMNQIRRLRASTPNLERELFENRKEWSDLQISQNLMAVQLANIFEWAYLARRDGLIEKDVWESWVETWRSVILSSESLRKSFTSSVWTFGRMNDLTKTLTDLVQGAGSIGDPFRG